MSSTDEMIKAFLARGGKVTRAAEGASNGMTEKDWYKAIRGELVAAPAMDPTEERRIVDTGRGVMIYNGLGELIAVE